MADQTKSEQGSAVTQPFFVRIHTLLKQGYEPQAILSNLMTAQPSMSPAITQSLKQGKTPSIILKEISTQSAKNYGSSAYDEGMKANEVLKSPFLQFQKSVPLGKQIGGVISGIEGLGEAGGQFTSGAIKGAGTTLNTVSEMGQEIGKKVGIIGKEEPIAKIPEKVVTPTTGMEKAGFATEQVAEFFAPSGIEKNIALKLDDLSKAGKLNQWFNLGGKALTSAATTGAVSGLQTGSPEGAQKGAWIGGLLTGVGGALGKGVDAITKSKGLVSLLSKATNYSETAVQDALKRTEGAVEGVKKGQSALNNMVVKANEKIFTMADKAKTTSRAFVDKLEKGLSSMYKEHSRMGQKATFDYLREEGTNFLKNVQNTLNKNFNIGTTLDKKGSIILDFDRTKYPSNIISSAEKSAVQEAWDTMVRMYQHPTVKQIDSVFERLISLQTKTPVGAVTGAETKKIVGGMIDEVMGFAKSLGKVDERYAQYAKFAEDNVTERVFWEKAKEFFGDNAHIESDAVSLDKIARKLTNLYQDMSLATREELGKIGGKIEEDIAGTAAGTSIKEGATGFGKMPTSGRDILTQLIQFIPREAVKNFIATGKVTGEMNTKLRAISDLTGQTLEAIIKEMSLQK